MPAGPDPPPLPCALGAPLGTTARVSVGRLPKRAAPPRAWPWHSLSESASARWVREGGGDTGRRGAAAGSGACGGRGLGSLAARLAQPGGSPAPRSLAGSRRRFPLRVRPSAMCASVRAGTPARLFVSAFASGKEPARSRPPRPPGTLGSVVPPGAGPLTPCARRGLELPRAALGSAV